MGSNEEDRGSAGTPTLLGTQWIAPERSSRVGLRADPLALALAVTLVVGLAGCTTEAREKANLVTVAAGQAKVKAGQPATVEVVADTACGKDPTVQLTAHEKNTAGQAVRVVEASVVLTVQKSAVPFLPDPACAALVMPATLSSTFTPQTAGEWRIQGIGKFGPIALEATFSVE